LKFLTRYIKKGINEALGKITLADLNSKSSYLTPYLATIFAGSDTYYGSGFKDSNWLFQNAPLPGSNPGDHGFWEDVDGYWTGYSQEDTWTHSDRPTNGPVTGPAAYFNTLEHNLNTAIYYCTQAINYVLEKGGYSDCECSGENPPAEPNPNPDPVPDGDKVTIPVKDALDELSGLLFFNLVGLASTAIAIAQIKFWEKLLTKLGLKYA